MDKIDESKKHRLMRIAAIILLFINGVGAIYGGFSFMCFPDGSGINMPEHYLSGTPFSSYLIPGMVLIFMGIFSFFVLALVAIKHPHYPVYIWLQGCVLIFWILMQVILLSIFVGQQVVIGVIGLILSCIGYLLHRNKLHAERL